MKTRKPKQEPVDRGGRATEPQARIAHPWAKGPKDTEPAPRDPAPTEVRDDPVNRKHTRKRGTPESESQARVSDAPRAKRGAQPGNTNALKHGFYSSIFKENERRLLSEVPLTDLTAEIELIRVTNKRFLEALAATKGTLDFDTQLTALRAINLSAHSIATLLRAHALTSLHDKELAAALAELEAYDESHDPSQLP